MAEYIEREAAIKSAVGALHGVSQIVAVDVVEALENEPAADVAEVVRCKDCKHWGGITFGYICRRFSGTTLRNGTRENDYCSFGAKMVGKGE